MGPVLEMIEVRQWRYALLAAIFVSGCAKAPTRGSIVESALGVLGQADSESTSDGSDDSMPEAQIATSFAPAAIAADPSSYRLVQINALGLVEPAKVIQVNGDEVTIQLESGPTAAFDGGVLVSTRGFGVDLLTLDAPGLTDVLRRGGGSLSRHMEVLDAQDQIQVDVYECSVTAAGMETISLGVREASLRRLDERCQGEAVIFDNIYWVDGSGVIVASRQYVSPGVAYLRSNRL